jgi:hypothetical protein
VWCQDEAGPYQAIPQAGASWGRRGHPAQQPHEYVRGGTAKMLSLFRPATGELRAKGVESAPNTVLHPWLKGELAGIFKETGPGMSPEESAALWATWLGYTPQNSLPPLRGILIWDNLAGHYTPEVVRWLFAQGVLPLYTPISGSWLNMVESVQRIIVGRALAGQHPQQPEELIGWLEDTVTGWNAHPTPFSWGGKRRERRQRARCRRLGGSGAVIMNGYSIAG